eukprot:TRINITY_DN4071_c0_g2_i16.p2 TRINITY_DN4071_c0_g2~~TRINITY_DN4071_c0_g2_i16.p2  ORF type:complete len:168 (-),score=54.41 TRINITY_DN4071_c0_g2_i16:397-900(-)
MSIIACFFFLNDTATTEIYTLHIVGSVRCVQETGTWDIGVQKREAALLVPNAALRFKPADAAAADKKPENGQKAAPTGGMSGMGPGMGGDGSAPKAGGGKGKKRDGQSGTVYILSGGEIKPLAIQLGITDNRNTEVVGGELKEGDRVITGENTNGVKPPSSVGMRMF